MALALEPRVERVISLDLADVAAQIPADYIKPIESIDGTRRILLKAPRSKEEWPRANRPFRSPPSTSRCRRFSCAPSLRPMTRKCSFRSRKCSSNSRSLQVRSDQERHQAVPQVETPFLQVTLEDNSRFGTTIEAVETGGSAAGADRAAHGGSVCRRRARSRHERLCPASGERRTHQLHRRASPLNFHRMERAAPHLRVFQPQAGRPFRLLSRPQPEPTRIPFKMTAPSDDLRPKDEPWLTAESLAASAEAPVAAPVARRRRASPR